MGLAENEVDAPRNKFLWFFIGGSVLGIVVSIVVGVALIVALVLGIQGLTKKKPDKKSGTIKVAILDRVKPPPPPPPPPPPKVMQQQNKDTKVEQVKQVEAPPQAAPALKMEGEASANGVSGLSAGAVTGEYKGQALGDGQKAGGGIGRAEFAVYLTRLQRLIQEELVRNPRLKGSNYKLPASVRLREDGSLRSVDLDGTTGDAEIDELMRSELLRLIKKDPPPASAPQGGFTVRVTNRMLN
ncbi:hypothetical protein GCM10027046_09090 [Uliginosibacterium flavum]|uniref:Uncharacterized protein n=1 Tax=Uliginosibacterium flavum TaxID=1396831 RepID=A0ABV2TIA0_9RHOO